MLNRQAKLKQFIKTLLSQPIGTENMWSYKSKGKMTEKEGSPALWSIRVIDIFKPKMEIDTVLLCIRQPPL